MAIHECRAVVKTGQGPELDAWLNDNEVTEWMLVEDPIAGSSVLVGYFESRERAALAWSELAETGQAFLEPGEPVFCPLADRDWKESYREHFTAWHSGTVHWVPVWERDTYRLPPGDVAIWLDPGMAFGTGNHETTRLCLERITDFMSGLGADQEVIAACRVIDAGSGSGILSLSAAALGLGSVRGFDVDPESVRVSRENAVLNGLEDRVVFEEADLETGLRNEQADLVLANILADVLVRERERLLAAVAPGGRLVLSGILAVEVERVRAAFEQAGSVFRFSSRTMGEWADLLAVRPT